MACLLLGIDGGTESLRAGVFTAAGALLGSCAAPYSTQYPAPGWAEQHPQDWWSSLGTAIKGALAAAGAQASDIAAMSLDTTCCTVCALDSAGDPLRPALLWMDMRSAAEAEALAAAGTPELRVNSGGHGPVSAEWMVPKALWLKRHEPLLWARAATVCEFQDYLNLKLTGRRVASLNNASVRWHFDIDRGWPVQLLAAVGLEDLQGKWPAEVLALGAEVGRLTASAAAHCGLHEGLLVAQGGADAFIGMLGLGVTRPGQMALLTGSSHLQLGLSAAPLSGRGIFGSYPSALLPGLHVVEGGQTSTGSIVNWFRRTLCGPGAAVDYATLNSEAAAVPPGCEGLTCLDHFQGNRTPHTDARSRGALAGLTLAHSRGHVFRSVLEGVAFGTRLILDTLLATGGYRPDSIAIAGGATRSALWLQIHADVAGVPFVLTQQTEAPMLGCAILAAVAAGLHPDILTAAAAMVHQDSVVHPDPGQAALYEPHFQRYCSLYPALVAGFHASAAAAATPAPHTLPAMRADPAAAAAVAEAAARDVGSAQNGLTAAAFGQGLPAVVEQASSSSQPALADAEPGQPPLAAAASSAAGLDSSSSAQELSARCDPQSAGHGMRGILSPSILAADFAHLADEVEAVLAAGSHWVHVDMFDGSGMANGNFTMGPPIVACLHAALPHALLDCHLAVDDPARYVSAVLAAGAHSITFHIEAPGLLVPEAPCAPPSPGTTCQPTMQSPSLAGHSAQPPAAASADASGNSAVPLLTPHALHSTPAAGPALADPEPGSGGPMGSVAGSAAALLAARIRAAGARAGIALAPDTPVAAVMPLVATGAVDMVLVMSVRPGWGGQAFLPEVLQKVAALRAAAPRMDIQVDGGITAETAASAVAAGANVLVAGTAVFAAGAALRGHAASHAAEAQRLEADTPAHAAASVKHGRCTVADRAACYAAPVRKLMAVMALQGLHV